MKGITATLLDEHRLIKRATACLEHLAAGAVEADDLCIVTAIDLLEFFQDFADGAHQTKEEEYLFPALLERGLMRERVLDLLRDHERERETLGAMWRSLERTTHGDPASRDEFVRLALEYAAFQREHADEEDRALLPLVPDLIDEQREARVLAGFRDVDTQLLRRPYEAYAALVDDVETRLSSALWTWNRGAGFVELAAGD